MARKKISGGRDPGSTDCTEAQLWRDSLRHDGQLLDEDPERSSERGADGGEPGHLRMGGLRIGVESA
jgi:hypothetical protein